MKGSKDVPTFGLRRCDGGSSLNAAILAASGALSVRVFRDAERSRIASPCSAAPSDDLGKCGADFQLLCGRVRNI